jgi:hypothetical protein
MNIAKSWADVTVKQFILANELTNDKSIEPVEKEIRLVSLLAGEKMEAIEALTISKFKELAAHLSFLNDTDIKGIHPSFKIGKHNVKVQYLITELTAGQYIDICEYTKKPEEIFNNIHNIMAVISDVYYSKMFKKVYLTHGEKSDLFYNQLTMDKCYPVAVFFWKVFQGLTKDILNSLNKEVRKMNEQIEAMNN